MAEDLGVARLRLEIDTSAFEAGLEDAKKLAANTRVSASAGRGSQSIGPDSQKFNKNSVREFNLRGTIATLDRFKTDLDQLNAARDLNIGTSWTKALATLSDVDSDLRLIAAGKKLNLNNSWNNFLKDLRETSELIQRSTANERGAQVARELVQNNRARLQQERQAKLRFNKRSQDALSSALIGGAFPALFGQGVGASLGGLIGGGVGGAAGGGFGFGLSLIGTALGAQFDEAGRKATLLGGALNDPVGKFQELAQAGLISSSALQKNIEALIENGKGAEAAARIQLDAASRFGDTSVYTNLAAANDELNRSFAQLSTILFKFAAGPLTEFANGLSLVVGAISQRQLVQERFKNLGLKDEQQKAILAQARVNTLNERQGQTVAQGTVAFYREVNRLLDQQYGKLKNVAAAEQLILQAQQRQSQLRSNSFRLVDAEVFGNKKLALEIEKQSIELQRIEDLRAQGSKISPEKRRNIDEQAALKTYRINQLIAQQDRDSAANKIVSANKLRAIENETFIQQQRQRLGPAGIQALEAAQRFKDTLAAAQEAQARAATTPGDQQLQSQAREAAKSVEAAAARTKQDFLDAFKAAKEAVRQIGQSIEDAQLTLLRQQGSQSEGLNRFLTGQALYNNQQIAFQQLLPRFLIARENAARDADRLGNPFAAEQFRNLNFQGPISEVNRALSDFIAAQNSTQRLNEEVARLQEQLVKAQNDVVTTGGLIKTSNETLNRLLPPLSESINALVNKNWNVYVAVPGSVKGGEIYE